MESLVHRNFIPQDHRGKGVVRGRQVILKTTRILGQLFILTFLRDGPVIETGSFVREGQKQNKTKRFTCLS